MLRPSRADEFRALWVDAWGSGFLTAGEVTTLVNRCRTYNFNAVIVQMRRRGDAFYVPQSPNGDPRTTVIAAGYDALQELINQCHTGTPRIEVHCWVVSNLIWSDDVTAPSQAGHVYNTHPEYLMRDSAGNNFLAEGFFLDPGNPDAMLWNYNMAKDIVSRYDIDGFQWDYIRYPQQDAGYNPVAIARYNAEFGLSGQPSPSNTQFSNWRRRQITDFLRWTDADLLAIKPNLQISTSVFSSRSDAFNARFQDWATWNAEGIIDLCMPMDYSADNSGVFFPRVDDAYNNQGVRRVYVGQGAYLNTKENTVTQFNYVRAKPLLGMILYSYRVPNSGTVNQTTTLAYVRDNYQPTWQDTPSIPWKASPTKGIVKGTVTRQDNGAAIYNATITLNSTPVRTQKTEPHGKYAYFETTPGTYTISATASGLGTANGNVTVTAGGNVTINLAVPTADVTPPTISSIASSAITDTSAKITWTTDESSDSTVEFGLTTSYGSSTNNASSVTSHTINLIGLSASTTYHYRVKSKDASNNTGTSSDFTFTTLASGTVTDIIIDNTAATVTGTWSTGTSSTDKYLTDYRFHANGTGANYLQFTPNILTAGDYDVFEWHPQGSNRATNAPHIATHSAGTTTPTVNQQINGGQWNLLGRFTFPVGSTKYVRITDNIPTSSLVVMADAIKFVYVAPAAPPAAPSGLTANGVNTSQIDLAWTDNSSDENNFVVARSTTSGGTFTDIATLAANTTSYSNTGLPPGTTYYYRVRATNGNGDSANSNEDSATTLLPPPPNAPTNLVVTALSTSQIKLTWADASANENNFVVLRSTTTGGPYSIIATLPANTTVYTNSSLTANTTYYYLVRATNAGGDSDDSNEDSATTFGTAPAAPSGLGATTINTSQISLSWTDNSANETTFVIGRSTTSGGPYTDIATVAANTTAYGDSGLSAATAYYYVVRATNASGSSANSAQASATTLPNPPNAPSSLVAKAVRATQINLSWTDNSANETSFIVGRSTTSGGPYSDIATLAANATSFSNTNLSTNTTYYYVVRAANSGGSSGNATESSATTYETDLRIDNRSAVVVGAWTVGTSSTDKYSTDYLFNGSGTGSEYVEFTPYIATAGSYQVYEWHPQGSNRATNAPHVITHSGGTTTVAVNQTINGGQWNLLGTFTFAAGSAGNIRVTDNFSGTSVVMADAIQLVPAAPPSAPSGLSATTISKSQINLAWTDNASNESNFVVARSTTAGGPYTDVATLAANTTSFSNTGLVSNTTYYYRVRATNSGGASANSNEASATTKRAVHIDSISMSWVTPSGNRYRSRATITVKDASGANVNSATLTGNFTGSIVESGLTGITSAGVATITTTSRIATGTVTFTVTGISGTNMEYDSAANVVTSATHSR